MQYTKSPYPTKDSNKNCFVMMRYRTGKKFRDIERIIRDTLRQYGILAACARDKSQNQLLWANVRAYMDHAGFGIAVFDDIDSYKEGEPRANPNVCMELGYMLAKQADCLILLDTAGRSAMSEKPFSDLAGHIVQNFDSRHLGKDFAQKIGDWIQQRVQIAPMFDGFAQMFPRSKIARRIKEQPLEKLEIAHRLVDKWQNEFGIPGSVLLDSGTTAAAVAEVIMLKAKHFEKSEVYTNNLLVSLMLSSKNQLRCNVLSGVADDTFACVFTDPPHKAMPKVQAAVISCTGFSPKLGPLANSPKNRAFKLAAFRKCDECYVVFGSDKLQTRGAGNPVFTNTREWQGILKTKVRSIITGNTTNGNSAARRKFRKALEFKLTEV